MIEKVKLTREQATAIEGLRENKFENDTIVHNAVSVKLTGNGIGRWFETLSAMDLDTLIKALYVGYEVESNFQFGDWVVDQTNNRITVLVSKDFIEDLQIGLIKNYRHATPEEITKEKERRFWKAIGREVGEFGHSDILMDDCGRVYRTFEVNAKEVYKSGKLKGFYPAESFIKFGGDDK